MKKSEINNRMLFKNRAGDLLVLLERDSGLAFYDGLN